MVNVRFAPKARGGAVALLGLAILVAGYYLNAGLGARLEAGARGIQANFESRTGLLVSFGSLSPSILRGLSIGDLELRDSRGRSILVARKAYVRYDLLALVRPTRGELIRELSLVDAALVLDPQDLALLTGLGGKGSSSPSSPGPAIPPIALSGTRVSLRLEGFPSGGLEAELSHFRLAGLGKELSFSLGGKLSTGSIPALGRLELSLSASGSLERDLARARARLSIQASSDLLSLRPQSVELSYGEGILELRKIEDKAPIDAWLRLDRKGDRLEARLSMEGFAPSTALVPGRNLRAFEPWFDLPYTGSLSLSLPLSDPEKLGYEGRLSGHLPSSLLGEGYRADIQAKGNLDKVEISLARLEGPPGSASFQGSLVFRSLSPSGHLDVDLGLKGGELSLTAGVDVRSSEGYYSLSSASVLFGGVELRDVDFLARRQGEEYAASLAFLLPEAKAPAEPARFVCDANFSLGKKAQLRANMSLEDGSLSSTRPLLGTLFSPGLAAFFGGLRVGGSLAVRSDFHFISYSTSDLSIASDSDPGIGALLKISGSEKHLVLEDAQIRYGSNAAAAKGSVEFAGTKGLGFAVQLSLGGQSYSLEGAMAGGSLHASGSYGLEFSSHVVDGATFLSAQAKNLPIPGLGLPLFASFELDGRYASTTSWSLALASLDLALPQSGGGDLRLGLSGLFGPGAGTIPLLRYQDRTSELSGSAVLDLRGGAEGLGLSSRLTGPNGEAYDLKGSLKTGFLDVSLVASASPLARLWSGPVTGWVGGVVSARGSLENLGLSFDLRLEKARYQSSDLALRAKGDWSEGVLRVRDCAASWQGYSIEGVTASLGSSRLDLDLAARVKAIVGSSPMTASLAFSGSVPELNALETEDGQSSLARLSGLVGKLGKTQRYRLEGLAKDFAFQGKVTPKWPIVINLMPTALAFDGGRDEVVLEYRSGGHFSLEARPPFPIQASLEGTIAAGQIDAQARGLNIDLPVALSLLGRIPVDISQGRLSGELWVHGPLNQPDMDGSLALDSLFLTVPGWVTSPVGPITAPILVAGKHMSLVAPSVAAGEATLMIEASADLAGWLPKDLKGRAKTLTSSPLPAAAHILGVSVVGQALLDLGFGYSGGIASIDGSVAIQKAKVIIDPAGFQKSRVESVPSTFFDVNISLAVGPGVKVYFPSTDFPIVMGYADPASALRVGYDQESGDLSFKGTVFLRGGEVFYVQRDFFLKNAKIVFNENETKFDPLITFLAERRARNGDGSILISLRADNSPLFNLQPRLSSSPVMSEGQIVSLLGANLLGAQDAGDVSIVKAAIMGTEMIPQLNVAKAFEEKVRDALGLDIFFVQTQVVQRWLYDVTGAGQEGEGGSLASYLDDTSLYLGKYLGDNIFVHAAALLQKDPLVPSGPLRLDSEFGVELEAPFGTITWSIKPESPESLFISDQSLSLTWKVQL